MNGKFAAFLAQTAPQDLLVWALTESGPPYLSCTQLEECFSGFLRVQTDAPRQAVLLVRAHDIAWVLEQQESAPFGFGGN